MITAGGLCVALVAFGVIVRGALLLGVATELLGDAWRRRRARRARSAAVAAARVRAIESAATPANPLVRLCTVRGLEYCAVHDRITCPQCITRIWLTAYRSAEWRASGDRPAGGQELAGRLTCIDCPTCAVAVALPGPEERPR